MYKNTFTNEIENKITVKVKNVKTTGVNNKTKEKFKFDAVYLELAGPTSVSGNTMTYKEAKEIYRGLSVFFKDHKMKTLKKI